MIRTRIIKLGLVKTVFLITLFSIISSITMYIAVWYFFLEELLFSGIVMSTLTPAILTPLISWYIIKLLIKIHQSEIEMEKLITYDHLTTVMARQPFLINAQTIYNASKRDKLSMAVLYIDIDDFKKINDTYGHFIGDKVLISFGEILNTTKRASDLVGRLGGEEFAFILPSSDADGAKKFASKLIKIINETVIPFDDFKIKFAISIGIAIFNQNNLVSLDELFKQSDKALYIAKNSGKNCSELYSEYDS